MTLLADSIGWLADPANWRGAQGIATRLGEHVQISLLAVALSGVVALPAGLLIGHARRGEFVVTSLVNVGRAVPSFAILALALPFSIRLGLGLGFWPALLALFLLGIPPILTNTAAGIQSVDADAVEAARGMGMRARQVLARLELPLAAPLIVAGVRTAAVQVVATATLAALVAWGGLGRYITDGFAVGDNVMVVGGALLVAALAVVTELAFGLVGHAVKPRTASGAAAGAGAVTGPGPAL